MSFCSNTRLIFLGLIFSTFSGLIGTFLYRTLYGFVLRSLPYSFTLGEADIVSQAVTLFLYSTTFNIYNVIHNVPWGVSQVSTVLIQVLSH